VREIARYTSISLLALALAIAGLITTPRPAEATTDLGCIFAERGVHFDPAGNRWSVAIRVCTNWANDHQSIRARAGWECRRASIRTSGCRVDFSPLELWHRLVGGSTWWLEADDNFIQPAAPNFSDGSIAWGHWFNPQGCWPDGDVWHATLNTSHVRYQSDNALVSLDPPITSQNVSPDVPGGC
jgi:hypothetical protein